MSPLVDIVRGVSQAYTSMAKVPAKGVLDLLCVPIISFVSKQASSATSVTSGRSPKIIDRDEVSAFALSKKAEGSDLCIENLTRYNDSTAAFDVGIKQEARCLCH